MPSSLDCSWARYWVFYCIPGRPFWGICYIVPSLTCIFDIKWISNLTKTCSNHLSFIFWCCLIFLVSCDPLEGYGQVCDWYVDMFSLPLVIYIYIYVLKVTVSMKSPKSISNMYGKEKLIQAVIFHLRRDWSSANHS